MQTVNARQCLLALLSSADVPPTNVAAVAGVSLSPPHASDNITATKEFTKHTANCQLYRTSRCLRSTSMQLSKAAFRDGVL